MKFARLRSISLWAHVIYLVLVVSAGTIASWMLWFSWFNDALLSTIVVGTLEVLAISSLLLYVAHVQWPLAPFRHVLPFLSIAPLATELYNQLSTRNSNWVAIPVSAGLGLWFLFLSHVLLSSFEKLFIDATEAARERAADQMSRLRQDLAIYQETRNAAESFARQIMPSVVPVSTPEPKQLPAPAQLTLSDSADPRFLSIVRMAAQTEENGRWTFDPQQIQSFTRANQTLVEVVCKMVRSGQLHVPQGD